MLFVDCFETTSEWLIAYIPYYYVVKLVILIVLMFLGGSSFIFDCIIAPFVLYQEEGLKKKLGLKKSE